jgi:hypothetical protein
LLIVEGPDCVGKTNLVNKLAMLLDSEAARGPAGAGRGRVRRVKFGLAESGEATMDASRRLIGAMTVSDRSWMSELVYGEVVRRGSALSARKLRHIWSAFRAVGGLYVMVVAEPRHYRGVLDRLHASTGQAFDVGACEAANRVYRASYRDGLAVGEDQPDFRFEIGEDGDWPSSDEAFVGGVARAYVRRQRSLGLWVSPACVLEAVREAAWRHAEDAHPWRLAPPVGETSGETPAVAESQVGSRAEPPPESQT